MVRLVGGWRIRSVATGLAVGIGVMAVLGALHALDVLRSSVFDLNAEWSMPAFFSGAILAAASVTALLVGLGVATDARTKAAGLGLFLVFGYMACDEVLAFHERLERILSIDWENLYLPLLLVAGILWVMALPAIWRVAFPARLAWLLGPVGWLVSDVLEKLEYDARDMRVPLYGKMVFVEEIAEMVGSALLLLGLLMLIRSAVREWDRPQHPDRPGGDR